MLSAGLEAVVRPDDATPRATGAEQQHQRGDCARVHELTTLCPDPPVRHIAARGRVFCRISVVSIVFLGRGAPLAIATTALAAPSSYVGLLEVRSMRFVVVLFGLLVVIGGLSTVKYKQISMLISMGHAMEKSGPPPEAVGTSLAKADSWQEALDSVGSVTPARGVTVSNDAAGIVSAIHFESGDIVREGAVLIELDSNVERSQLAAAEARRELAQINAGRTRALVASDALPRAQQDSDEAVVKTSRGDLGALRAQIARKIVRAPFSGKLGIRQVNLGQYLNPGTAITTLEATDTVFVDFTLPQQRLKEVSLGMPVRTVIEGEGTGATDGAIKAIDPSIDAVTRSIKLRAGLDNRDQKLLPGMFARVSVILPGMHDVVTVPVSAIVRASFGDSVFVVEDRKDEGGNVVKGPDGAPGKMVRQQFVRLAETRGDFVAVAQGVTAGQEVVTAGAFKLRNGVPVRVDNGVQAKADIAPHPENR
jgi:membrane fusion protein (multidrug efflux system)